MHHQMQANGTSAGGMDAMAMVHVFGASEPLLIVPECNDQAPEAQEHQRQSVLGQTHDYAYTTEGGMRCGVVNESSDEVYHVMSPCFTDSLYHHLP